MHMTNGVRILRSLGFVFALISVVAFGAILALGQAIDGNVVGTVTDASGAAVVGAEVTATNVATNVSATGKTNGSGEYRFDHLLIGTYRISVKMTGFKTISEQVDVEVSKTATRNISLQPGAASETVEVSGTPPTLDTTTAQIQSTYELRETQDLPTASIGLGVLNLSLLQAGVGSSGGLGAGTGPSIGGQRPRDNNFMIEGTDNNDKGVTGPLAYVPNDAVQNFSILQNQFSPEFGHSNGGQFNTIVVSGTNTWHGRAYEYFQNRNLNALDTSLSNQGITKLPRYDNNRFGGQVGGPIVKNRLFFFVNFEYNPIGQAASSGNVVCAPTAAGYSSLLGVSGVSASNVQGLQKYAQAPAADTSGVCTQSVVSGTTIQTGILPIIAPNFNNTRALVTSMDYNISDKDQIRGRYIYNKLVTLDTGAQLGLFYTPFLQPYHLVSLSEYHTFSAALGNEFRLGFTRTAQNFTAPGGALGKFQNLDAFPNLTITELGGLDVGPDPNAPQYAIQNNYQAVDNASFVKGNHSLKFGFEGRKNISPQKFIQRSRGDYIYKTLQTFALDQVPGFGQRSFGQVGYSGDQYGLFGYVNDIWKLRPNLSLNLGVRYEYTSTPYGWTQQSLNAVANDPGLITFGSPQAPKHDFMPRVGFAYSPGASGNTSIRGGFGLGYDVLYDNIGVLSRPPQIGSTANCPGAACQNPFLANGGIAPQASSGITVLDQATARGNTSSYLPNNVKYPYAESWNFGVQHVFKSNYTADIRYVGSRGIDLNVQNILNFVPGVNSTAGYNVPTYITMPSAATIAALTTVYGSAAPSCNTGVSNPTKTGFNPACPSGAGDVLPTAAFPNQALLVGYNDTGTGPGGFYDPHYLNDGFFSPITSFQPWGSSTYHGLQTQLNRRFSNGLQFQVAYTWSHTIDNSTADFHSTDISPRRPQDFRNLPAERANSILDHANRLTVTAIYDAPWFKSSSSSLLKNTVGNWEIAPVYTYESGQWGTVQSGIDSNMNADAAPDRAIFNPSGTSNVGSDVSPITNNTTCSLPPCIVGWVANNPSARYIVAGQGSIATSTRNTLVTPAINNWDITMAKHIAITERYKIDFMAQAFNVFNHPQWVTGSVNNVNSISDVGGARSYFIPSDPNFANAKTNFASNARTMQLGLKFIF
jgi:hypothetical protein